MPFAGSSLRWRAQQLISVQSRHITDLVPRNPSQNNMGNTFASAELPTGPVECSYTPPLKVNPSNPKVFFDMMIGSAQIGRIVMELKADVAPSAQVKSRGDMMPTTPSTRHTGSTEDCRKLPRLMYGREGLRLQGLVVPPRDSEVHVPGW